MNRVDLLRSRAISVIFILVAAILASVAGVQREASGDTLKQLKNLATAFQIEVVTTHARFPIKSRYGMIDGQRADGEELERYASLFVSEFSLYPPTLMQRTRLRRVVLCEKLSFGGQRRNAIPDFEHNTLYLEVSRGNYSERYMRGVIHHEFFHIIDYAADGRVYQDNRWQALNPAKFKYGRGGRNAQNRSTTSVLTDKYPGFLNHYSTTGVEEDKAEVFANMIVNPAYVERRTKKDGVVKAKVRLMKDLLVRFCPDMNERFWEKAGKIKRPDK